jgi:hypothetical protein
MSGHCDIGRVEIMPNVSSGRICSTNSVVRIGRLEQVRPEPVHDRVGHLVGDDVVRVTGEDELAGQVVARILRIGAKVPEQDAVQVPLVVRVGPVERVREESQLLVPALGELDRPAERPIEVLERGAMLRARLRSRSVTGGASVDLIGLHPREE